nr:MAG TPA: hypothetical protein [Caudoviricetes sp.]
MQEKARRIVMNYFNDHVKAENMLAHEYGIKTIEE